MPGKKKKKAKKGKKGGGESVSEDAADGGSPKWKPPVVDKVGSVKATFAEWGPIGVSWNDAVHDKQGRMAVKGIKAESASPPEVCPGIVLVSINGAKTAGQSYDEQVKMIRNSGRPMKLIFHPPASSIPRCRLKPAVPGDLLITATKQPVRQGPDKGSNQCRWSLKEGMEVTCQQTFYDELGVHRMKIAHVDKKKFEHTGWVRQNDAKTTYFAATQPLNWGQEDAVEPEPEPSADPAAVAHSEWGALGQAVRGGGGGGAGDADNRAASVAAAFAAAAGSESADVRALKAKLAKVRANQQAPVEEGVPPEPEPEEEDDDSSAGKKKKKVKKMSKKKQAAHDYKMQMQEEGDRMLAEIKATKAKAALEEEEKLLQQELRQTVATEKKVRTKTLLEEGQQKLGAKEYGAAEKMFSSALVLCSDVERRQLLTLQEEAKVKKEGKEIADEGLILLEMEQPEPAMAKYKAALQKDPGNEIYIQQLMNCEKMEEDQAPMRQAEAEELERQHQLEVEQEQRQLLEGKMGRLLSAARAQMGEASTRGECRAVATLCGKALALDQDERYEGRAEFESIKRSAENQAHAYKLADQADMAMEDGRTQDAIALYDQALEQDSSNERFLDARNEAVFRANDEAAERKAVVKRQADLTARIEATKAKLDAANARKQEKIRLVAEEAKLKEELEEAKAESASAKEKAEQAGDDAETEGVGTLFAQDNSPTKRAAAALAEAEKAKVKAEYAVMKCGARMVELEEQDKLSDQVIEEATAELQSLQEEQEEMAAEAEEQRAQDQGNATKALARIQEMQKEAAADMAAKDYDSAAATYAKALTARTFLESSLIAELEQLERKADSMARAQQLAAEGDEQILEGHGTEGRLKYEQAIKLDPDNPVWPEARDAALEQRRVLAEEKKDSLGDAVAQRKKEMEAKRTRQKEERLQKKLDDLIAKAEAQVAADDYVGAGSTCGNALALIDESHKSWDALIQLEARADNNAEVEQLMNHARELRLAKDLAGAIKCVDDAIALDSEKHVKGKRGFRAQLEHELEDAEIEHEGKHAERTQAKLDEVHREVEAERRRVHREADAHVAAVEAEEEAEEQAASAKSKAEAKAKADAAKAADRARLREYHCDNQINIKGFTTIGTVSAEYDTLESAWGEPRSALRDSVEWRVMGQYDGRHMIVQVTGVVDRDIGGEVDWNVRAMEDLLGEKTELSFVRTMIVKAADDLAEAHRIEHGSGLEKFRIDNDLNIKTMKDGGTVTSNFNLLRYTFGPPKHGQQKGKLVEWRMMGVMNGAWVALAVRQPKVKPILDLREQLDWTVLTASADHGSCIDFITAELKSHRARSNWKVGKLALTMMKKHSADDDDDI